MLTTIFVRGRYALCLLIIAFLFLGCDESQSGEDNPPDVSLAERNDQLRSALNAAAPDGEDAAFFRLPDSYDFESIPQDPNNRITQAKVRLGRLLYHETGMAVNPMETSGVTMETYSCASCHHSRAGFQSGRIQGVSEGGVGFGAKGEARTNHASIAPAMLDVQPIRTPTAMNGAYQELMLWNGQFGATGANIGTEAQWTPDTPKETNTLGFEGLETQAIAGLQVHRMGDGAAEVAQNATYQRLFAEAFPESAVGERYSRINAGLAIAAYERTLLANQAPFQRWLRGQEGALNRDELEGALLFFGKANCVACHTGPALNDMNFYAYGMPDLDGFGVYGDLKDPNEGENLGRGGFTGVEADYYKFKTPQLYNLRDVAHLGHGGNFSNVMEVVAYKNAGIAARSDIPASQLTEEFVPLGLTEAEVTQLVAFIENALYDPNLRRYEPVQAQMPTGNCPIVNDPQSRLDLGCAAPPNQ